MDINPGEYCGVSTLKGTTCDIYSKGGHFGAVFSNKFMGHVKKATLRKAGIFSPGSPRKKIYGGSGYIGCP